MGSSSNLPPRLLSDGSLRSQKACPLAGGRYGYKTLFAEH
jgi:hypothetical protein